MRSIKLIVILIGLLLLPIIAFTQDISEYLILQDIGSYIRKVQTKDFRTLQLKTIPGYIITNNSGVLMGDDHFLFDHMDKSYETIYNSDVTDLSVNVQVTQHTGGDSDRWLLHEIDAEFRTYYGIPDDAYAMRQINSNNIMTDGTGGWTYRWLNGNKVINIEYIDLQMNKPEPLEVLQAYLTKFPSTLPSVTSADLRTSGNQIKWIKDEIDRRLWLCDKWNAQFQAGQTTQKDLLYNLNRSIGVFLNYRQKYYGVSATDDQTAISVYMQNNDVTSIQTKLTAYKTWWNANKGKSISL